MKTEFQRLFINNLPDNITQIELEKKFSDYGKVTSVEIKERKSVTTNQTPHFAYIQLEIERPNLQNCLENFSNQKWKNQYINVQIAKESFMERLKREREEVKTNGVVVNSTSNNDHVETRPTTIISNGALAISRVPIHPSDLNMQNKVDVEVPNMVIKNNITKEINDPKVVNKPEKSKKLDLKQLQADKKRLSSLAQMKEGYRQQKCLIKNALANIDIKPKNKIIFNDEDETKSLQKNNKVNNCLSDTKNSNAQNKFTLFDEAEEDEDNQEYNFEVKDHHEGKKGKKLMELQSKFKNDKRFTMDERFLEKESDEEAENENAAQENEEITHENEKEKQFEILEQVLGKKVSRKPTEKANDSKKPKMMLRFDPSQPEHSKYEVNETVHKEKKRKRNDSEKQIETKPIEEEAPKPEVSKSTFYKVAVNLKDALHEKEEFSLANLFSSEIEKDVPEENVEERPKEIKKQKRLGHEPNPFRYDSSTDEEEEEKSQEKPKIAENNKTEDSTLLQRTKPVRIWTEPFFFKNDDYRLQEGFDFIKKLELNDQEDFLKLRRNLKEIVRAKVKNNQRNNRPFKQKLGGKKRLRVKRALKR